MQKRELIGQFIRMPELLLLRHWQREKAACHSGQCRMPANDVTSDWRVRGRGRS